MTVPSTLQFFSLPPRMKQTILAKPNTINTPAATPGTYDHSLIYLMVTPLVDTAMP